MISKRTLAMSISTNYQTSCWWIIATAKLQVALFGCWCLWISEHKVFFSSTCHRWQWWKQSITVSVVFVIESQTRQTLVPSKVTSLDQQGGTMIQRIVVTFHQTQAQQVCLRNIEDTTRPCRVLVHPPPPPPPAGPTFEALHLDCLLAGPSINLTFCFPNNNYSNGLFNCYI